MRLVGLTGGIASGKSTVSNLFKSSGVPVVDGDVIARDVVRKGTGGWKKIVATFGEDILQENGEIDRVHLGQIVFSDPAKRQLLNRCDICVAGPLKMQNLKEEADTFMRVLKARHFHKFSAIDRLWWQGLARILADKGYIREGDDLLKDNWCFEKSFAFFSSEICQGKYLWKMMANSMLVLATNALVGKKHHTKIPMKFLLWQEIQRTR